MSDRWPAEIEELLAVYALDAVDEDERALVDDYLRENPRAVAEVESYREALSYLHAGAAAPPGLWERIATELESAPPPLRLEAFRGPTSRSEGRSGPGDSSLLLVATRTMYDQGVGLQNSPSSAHLAPSTAVCLNPADFDKLGVASGTTVRVATVRGSVDAPVVADGGVPEGTAAMVFNQANAPATALIDASTRVTAVRVERP